MRIKSPEELELERQPEYTDEDLAKLVSFVKRMTTLYDLRETDWNEECEEVIRQFFLIRKQPILTIYFDSDILNCMLGFPDTPIVDLTYFLRDPMEIFEVDTFHDKVTFGTMDGNVENSILRVLENVYAQVFFNIKTWPDSVKADFCTNLHMFLAKLTDLHHKMFGLTVIYVPKEGLGMTAEVASKDKELVKRLEGIVVYWTRQIRIGLQDQDQNSPSELLCPNDEYEFWKYRCKKICFFYPADSCFIFHFNKFKKQMQK